MLCLSTQALSQKGHPGSPLGKSTFWEQNSREQKEREHLAPPVGAVHVNDVCWPPAPHTSRWWPRGHHRGVGGGDHPHRPPQWKGLQIRALGTTSGHSSPFHPYPTRRALHSGLESLSCQLQRFPNQAVLQNPVRKLLKHRFRALAMSFVSFQNSYMQVLTPSASECGLAGEQGHCRHNLLRGSHMGVEGAPKTKGQVSP